MTGITATAPGKLVIAGEYAVLEGAPGIVLSVDVRAEAQVNVAATDVPRLRIANSGKEYRFAVHDTGIAWAGTDPGVDGQALGAAVAEMLEAGIRSEQLMLDVSLCSRAFQAGSLGKLGAGSSAAIAVALTAALTAWQDPRSALPEAIFECCLAVHRRMQGRQGSGIDVAASLYGGALAYTARATDAAHVSTLQWPVDLQVLPVWTGVAVRTSDMLDRLQAFRAGLPGSYAACMRLLMAAASDCVNAWQEGGAALLQALHGYREVLRELDKLGGIGIYSPVHLQLEGIAASYGLLCKPSGAGGGDLAIVLADASASLESLRQELQQQGFLLPALSPGVPGLAISSSVTRTVS